MNNEEEKTINENIDVVKKKKGVYDMDASSTNFIIRAVGAKKTFKDNKNEPVDVLKGVDLLVKKGEFVSLMGESGSGKSTLLYLLGYLDKPTEGEILFCGGDANRLTDDELAKLRREKIGFIFQFYNLIPNLNVEDNILLPVIMAGKNLKFYKEKLNSLLETIGLKDKAKSYPRQLSGGEQQRVSIARAVILEPALLLADEPTGNLDSASTIEVMKLFKRLNRENKITIVQVTHSKEVAEFTDRIIYLKDGLIVDKDEVFTTIVDDYVEKVDEDNFFMMPDNSKKSVRETEESEKSLLEKQKEVEEVMENVTDVVDDEPEMPVYEISDENHEQAMNENSQETIEPSLDNVSSTDDSMITVLNEESVKNNEEE